MAVSELRYPTLRRSPANLPHHGDGALASSGSGLWNGAFRIPSRWNPDHKRVYTPASLLAEFEAALAPNSYRVRHLLENDAGYRYDLPPNRHAEGCHEIELVIEKIAMPDWRMED